MTHVDINWIFLITLPWLLLAINPNWIFNAIGTVDPWLYFGYYVDLKDHLQAFDGTYYSTRLTILLPGWLAHKLFDPVTAHRVLHLSLYYVAVLSIYQTLKTVASNRAAFLGAALMGIDHYFRVAIRTDYADAFGIAYFSLAICALSRGNQSKRWPLWLAVAGASLTAVVIANLAYAILLPFPLLAYLVQNRSERQHRLWRGLAIVGLSGCALIVILGLINQSITGRFWFFLPSIRWAQANTQPGPWFRPYMVWSQIALWLVVPAVGSAASFLALTRCNRRSQHGQSRAHWAWIYHVQLLGLILIFAGLEFSGFIRVLQIPYYASLLLPPAFLAVGLHADRACRSLSRRAFWSLAGIGLILLIAGKLGSATTALAPIGDLALPVIPLSIGLGVVALLALPFRPASVAGLCGLFFFTGDINARAIPLGNNSLPPKLAAARSGQILNEIHADVDLHSHFLAVADAAQAVRSAGRHTETWFWYDDQDSYAPIYASSASTYNYMYRLIGTQFPDTNSITDSARQDMLTGRIRRIAVLSRDPLAGQKAADAFRKMGLQSRLIWYQAIQHKAVNTAVVILEISPRQFKREAVTPGFLWTKLESRTRVEGSPPSFRFQTSGQPWDYALAIPLASPDTDHKGSRLVQVQLTVDSGVVAIGLLHPNGQTISGERLVRSQPGVPQQVELILPPGAEVDRVLFRSGDAPGVAVVTVDSMVLYHLHEE